MRTPTLVCIGAIGAALMAPPVAATSALEPPELGDYLRWGPVRVRPGIELSSLGYDDNILLSSAESTVSDYTATVSPYAEGLLLFGHRAFLTFRERLDYTLYARTRGQNFFNQRGNARLTVPFRRSGLFTELTLNRLKLRPVELEDIRPESREGRLAAGVVLRPGWRTEIEIGGALSRLTHFDPDFRSAGRSISDVLDRREAGTTFAASYRLKGRTSAILDGRIKRIEFDERLDASTRDTREWRLLAGLRFDEGGRLTGSFALGWGRIDALDPTLPDLSELLGEAELIYRIGTRTRIKLESERVPGFSVYGGTTYLLDTHHELRAVRYFNRLFGVESGAVLGRLTFPEASGGVDREDRFRRYDAGIRLRLRENALGRRLEYSLRFGRYRRNSSLDAFDRAQNTFSLGAVVGF